MTVVSQGDRVIYTEAVAVEIIWQYESDDGMPDDETNANISRFEELLDDLSCENDFSYLIQVSTGMGEKRWLFYSIDLDRFTREFNLMVEDKLAFPACCQTLKSLLVKGRISNRDV